MIIGSSLIELLKRFKFKFEEIISTYLLSLNILIKYAIKEKKQRKKQEEQGSR